MKLKTLLLGFAVALGGLTLANAPQQAAQDKHGHGMAAPATADEEREVVATQSKEVAVSLKDFKFSPKLLRVKAGTKVTWTNKEGAPHTVTADKGEFDSGNLANGQSYSFTFAKAGTYKYHCNYHGSAGSGMAGTVKVTK
jgi:plastocyanin